jgi:hypothetical protein
MNLLTRNPVHRAPRHNILCIEGINLERHADAAVATSPAEG